MIIKASQRGGAMQLGAHLLKAENEHVEVHEISGFASDDLKGAMKEAQAVAKGTRCKQFLFSVSLNPPERESVGIEAFESAVNRIEEKMGLAGQPRMIVFHEKEGRRHCHAVWSRIDAATMTARPMSFFKAKLREVSKGLYLEHGWQMPRGLIDSRARDPRNFGLAEWQQAKRMGRDPRMLKATVQECWAASDSREAFRLALEQRGLHLARGDARAHVAVTYEGEALSIARLVGVKSKDIAAKLGKADDLRNVADTKAHIAATIAPKLREMIGHANAARDRDLAPLHERRQVMKDRHSVERHKLDEGQRMRSNREARERSGRLRHGVMGVWDRLTGRHGDTLKRNDAEALAAFRRDRTQRNALVTDQLAERRDPQCDIRVVRHRHAANILELHRDLARHDVQRDDKRESLTDSFRDASRDAAAESAGPRTILRGRGSGRDGQGVAKSRGPDLGR